MRDLVIVSLHEKGFPQADLYRGAAETASFVEFDLVPDGFFTMRRGDTLEAALDKAMQKWPNAVYLYEADDLDDDDEVAL